MNYQDINAQTIDIWVEGGWRWGVPISHETYRKALAGTWDIFLSPTRAVPHHWFGEVKGKKLLGLAAGGGQQMPIFAALGAECTVLDYSTRQIESERMVAAREGYEIDILQADMTKPLPFDDESFDLIVHPVSNCYVEDVRSIWRECYRVLRPGGVLLCGLDNGMNFIFDEEQRFLVNKLPFNPLRDSQLMQREIANGSGVQFSHTAEEQLGGQLEAGFVLTHIYEDTNGSGNLHEYGVPSFWVTRARKKER